MSAFLMGLLGAVVGLALLAMLGWWWLRRKLRRFVSEMGAALQAGEVPPLRITLESLHAEPGWRDPQTVHAITRALESRGYRAAGDFEIPELPGVVLRGMVNIDDCIAAALYEHPGVALPLLDLLRLHADRRHVMATTAPEDGMALPPSKSVRRFAIGHEDTDALMHGVDDMHEWVLAESGRSAALTLRPGLFPGLFTAAYAAEMDWRIRRGGITAEEVIAAAAAGGQPLPGEAQVDAVRTSWHAAIDAFVGEEACAAFIASGAVSAADWETWRDRILVVHPHVHREALVESIADDLLVDEDDDAQEDSGERHEALRARLRHAFAGDDPIADFIDLGRSVPGVRAYRHLGDVQRPWPAALYLRPE